MKNRLALVLSAAAVVVALLGATPVGSAAVGVVKRALFAANAGKVNGIKASKTAKPNQLLPLAKDAKFPLRTNGTSAAAAGSLKDPAAGPTDAIIAQAQITTSSPGRIMALGRTDVISFPCGGPAGTSCGFTVGLYVDGQPVPQTAVAAVPLCAIPGNPCFATASAQSLFGVVGVGVGRHTVTLGTKVTSGTVGTPSAAPAGEAGGIAVG